MSMKCLKPTLLSVTMCYRQKSTPRCLDDLDITKLPADRKSLSTAINIRSEYEAVYHYSNHIRHRYILF